MGVGEWGWVDRMSWGEVGFRGEGYHEASVFSKTNDAVRERAERGGEKQGYMRQESVRNRCIRGEKQVYARQVSAGETNEINVIRSGLRLRFFAWVGDTCGP